METSYSIRPDSEVHKTKKTCSFPISVSHFLVKRSEVRRRIRTKRVIVMVLLIPVIFKGHGYARRTGGKGGALRANNKKNVRVGPECVFSSVCFWQ